MSVLIRSYNSTSTTATIYIEANPTQNVAVYLNNSLKANINVVAGASRSYTYTGLSPSTTYDAKVVGDVS